MSLLTCSICSWQFLPKEKALVPHLDFITRERTIPLRDIVLEKHVFCRRCVGKFSGVVIYPFLRTKTLFTSLLARETERLEAEAKMEAERERRAAELAAEIAKMQQALEGAQRGVASCFSGKPLLPAMTIKTVDRHGRPLRGATAEAQVRKVLVQFKPSQERTRAKEATREHKKNMRAIRDARNEEMTQAIPSLHQAS